MTRKKTSPVEERARVVLSVLSGKLTMAETARRHGVADATVAKWQYRFVEAGKASLADGISGPGSAQAVAERRWRAESEIGMPVSLPQGYRADRKSWAIIRRKVFRDPPRERNRVWQTDFSEFEISTGGLADLRRHRLRHEVLPGHHSHSDRSGSRRRGLSPEGDRRSKKGSSVLESVDATHGRAGDRGQVG